VIGAQLGAYRVLYQIGEGSMGSVWLAQHAMLGSHAAIKVLHTAYAGREDLVSRFFNEARAATSIRDPGIVQVYDFGRHYDGSAFIVMELLEGEPLDRRLARVGTLDVRDALRIARQLATALAAAHARGIIHRDLKPENIFLVHDPEVAGGERAKLLDFGVAKLTGMPPMTRAYAVVGTPVYMSPEQCAGTGVDHRCDLYALGGVLYTLLTGVPPFDGTGMLELIAQHMTERPRAPSLRNPEVPPEVDALVLRCLAKDPADRFGSAHELAGAIAALLVRATLPSYEEPTLIARPSRHDVPTLIGHSTAASSKPLATLPSRSAHPTLKLPPRSENPTLPSHEVPTLRVPALAPRPRRWLAGVTALAALAGAIAFTIAVCG
jgi:eukaryotic-like serine/threonine-protein kinase